MKHTRNSMMVNRAVRGVAVAAVALSSVGVATAAPTTPAPTPTPTTAATSPSAAPSAPTTPAPTPSAAAPTTPAPSVRLTSVSNANSVAKGDNVYYVTAGDVHVNVNNVAGRAVTITAGEVGTTPATLHTSTAEKDDTLDIDLPDVTDKGLTVSVTIDGTVAFTKIIHKDSTAPVPGTATLVGEGAVANGKTVIRTGTKIKFDSFTDDVDVKSVALLQAQSSGDPKVIAVGTAGSEFAIPESGTYSVRVTDALGNEKVYNFSDLKGGYSSEVVIDDSTANVTSGVTVNGAPLGTEYYKDSAKVEVKVTGNSLLQHNEIKVNGKVVASENLSFNKEDKVYTVDLGTLERPTDGVYTIEVSSSVLFSKPLVSTYVVKVDYDAPTLDKATITGDNLTQDSKIYTKGTATISVPVTETASGVKSVKLVDQNGGTTSLEGSNGVYSGLLTAGTGLSVVVEDNVGHTVTKPLTDLGLSSNTVIIDGVAPSLVNTTAADVKYTDATSKRWVSSLPTFTYTVDDDHLSTVKATINGKEVTPTSDKNVYSVTSPATEPGEYTVVFTATDISGNVTSQSEVYYLDSTAPTSVEGTATTNFAKKAYGNFANAAVKVTVTANDGDGSGVKEYRLLSPNGDVVETSPTGEFTLDNSDGYSVIVVDNVGTVSEPVSVQKLLGTENAKFFIDPTAPTVNISLPGKTFNEWYGSDVDLTAAVSDDVALDNARLVVNGTEIGTWTATDLAKDTKLSFNTKDVAATENGEYLVEVIATDAAGNTTTSKESFKVDKTTPTVDGFTFVNPGYKEGQNIATDDNYGFYFDGATRVDIAVSDAAPSSGVRDVTYTLRNADGSVAHEGTAEVNGGVASVEIPNNFKGYISAKATDNVGHTSEERKPSGVITEDQNWHVTTTDVTITTPDTAHKDTQGNPLYNTDTSAKVTVSVPVSGLRSITWGIGNETLGNAEVGSNGALVGNGWSTTGADKNLVTGVIGDLPINGNANGMEIWVNVTDRAGHTTTQRRVVSIDKDAPIINVTYDNTKENPYYNSNRTATITVNERNFNPDDIRLSGNPGSISGWTNLGGDSWQATVTFANEGEVHWGVDYTDLAGNAAKGYVSDTFTIDKTAPKLAVTYSNDDVHNGKFYNKAHNATLTVTDRNFDPSRLNLTGTGNTTGWSQNGDTWSTTVPYSADGDYSFGVSLKDKADNEGNSYQSGEFTVDTTKPDLILKGVEQGVSYKDGTFNLVASPNDKHLNDAATSFSLTGRANGNIPLDGEFKNGSLVTKKGVPNEQKYDDQYTAKGIATDLAGNVTEKEVKFSVNRYGSLYSFGNAEFNGKFFKSLPNDITLSQTSVDRLDVNKFQVVILKNGKQIAIDKNLYTIVESGGVDGPWVYTLTVKKEAFKDDGVYQVQLFSESVDGGKKESSLQQEYSFVIDDTAPEVLISGIESNGSYTGVDRKVTIEVRDLSGPKTVSATLNGKPLNLTSTGDIYEATVPASSARQSLVVNVVDKAGNSGFTEIKDFRIISSRLEALLMNPWVQFFLSALGLLLLLALILIIWAWSKRRKERETHDKYVESVITYSGDVGSGGVNSGTHGSGSAIDGDEEGLSTLEEFDSESPEHEGNVAPTVEAPVAAASATAMAAAAAAGGVHGRRRRPEGSTEVTENITPVVNESTDPYSWGTEGTTETYGNTTEGATETYGNTTEGATETYENTAEGLSEENLSTEPYGEDSFDTNIYSSEDTSTGPLDK